MINQVIHGDCFEVLKTIPDGSIDAVITDPPYMTTDLNFDKTGFDVDLFLKLLLPKLKSDGQLAVFGSIELLAKFSGIYPIRWSGMWLKPRGVMRTHTAKKPMSKSEPYCIFAHPKHKVSNLVYNKILLPGEPYKKNKKILAMLEMAKIKLIEQILLHGLRTGIFQRIMGQDSKQMLLKHQTKNA